MNKYLFFPFSFLLIVSQFAWSQIPDGYYNDAENTSGTQLKSALNTIIDGHTNYSYSQVWDILRETDKDPNNSDNVILLYTGRSQEKFYQDSGSGDYSEYDNGNGTYNNSWNREHVWPKSHGFPSTSDTAYTDVHHLRPTDRTVNSARGTKDFDNGGSPHSEATDCNTDNDSWEPRVAVKGDVARMMFYMVVRYEDSSEYDLELVDYTGTSSNPILGKLSTLLSWHNQDPVDDFERNRNEVIYGYQNNRNPFIDHPNLVDHIWGSQQSTPWNSSLSASHTTRGNTLLYPNPSNKGVVFISSSSSFINARVVSLDGKKISEESLLPSQKTIHIPKKSGVYFIVLTDNYQNQSTHKLIVTSKR